MSKTTNKFSPEVRARAVRMVLDHEGEHTSRWAACREPRMVEAFFNGTVEDAYRDPETCEWRSLYIRGRSDFALIRSLRSGLKQRIAVRTLQLHDDEGLSHHGQSYATLPPPALVESNFRSKDGSAQAYCRACVG